MYSDRLAGYSIDAKIQNQHHCLKMNRLKLALNHLGYERDCQVFFRVELVTAVRKFSVMTGDLELEAACDELLAKLTLDAQGKALPLAGG